MGSDNAIRHHAHEAQVAKKLMLAFLFLAVLLFIIATGTQLNRIQTTLIMLAYIVALFNTQYLFLLWQEHLSYKRQYELYESIKNRGMHPQLLSQVHRIAKSMSQPRDPSTRRSFRAWAQLNANIIRRS